MKLLLVEVPSRRNQVTPPLGLLQVAANLERLGHETSIYDPAAEDLSLSSFSEQGLYSEIERFKPDLIGYGGIATSYGRAKRLALGVKNEYPGLMQIAGGPLASTYELLLRKARMDLVVHGESEVSLPLVLDSYASGTAFHEIPGISFINDSRIFRNQPAKQISDLDSLPLPAYHLVEMGRYFDTAKRSVVREGEILLPRKIAEEILSRIGEDDRWIDLIAGRGCTHRCLFCYRHVQGVRKYSVQYVINHIKFLMLEYGIRGFKITEELFNPSRKWVLDFCDAIEQNGLNIFYQVAAARVDRMDQFMLQRLKQTGCVEVCYGQESGSETILKELGKGVPAKANYDVTKLTKAMGMSCPVQLVIGSPSENDETIQENIEFLKAVEASVVSLNYLIPLPETPIWKYCEDRDLIPDVENYLDQVAEKGGLPLVNLTAVPDERWRDWGRVITKAQREIHYKLSMSTSRYAIHRLFQFLFGNVLEFARREVYLRLPPKMQEMCKLVLRRAA